MNSFTGPKAKSGRTVVKLNEPPYVKSLKSATSVKAWFGLDLVHANNRPRECITLRYLSRPLALIGKMHFCLRLFCLICQK